MHEMLWGIRAVVILGFCVLTFVIVPLVAAWFVVDLALIARDSQGLLTLGLATNDELAVTRKVVTAHGELAPVLPVVGGYNIALDGNGTIVVLADPLSVSVRHGTLVSEKEGRWRGKYEESG
jgi:anaerobic glycerol-3-phosphate dehydrogenase